MVSKNNKNDKNIKNKKLIKTCWTWFIISLIASFASGFFVHLHGEFGIDEQPWFYAIYGFIACLAIIIISKLLGPVLKRPENYYSSDEGGK